VRKGWPKKNELRAVLGVAEDRPALSVDDGMDGIRGEVEVG